MMMSTFITTLTQPALLAWLLKATALLVVALGVTSLLRRASAGTRHLVWLATLAGILLLPAVSLWTPLRLAIVPAELLPTLPRIAATPAPVSSVLSPSPDVARQRTPSDVAATESQLPSLTPAPLAPAPNERAFPVWAALLAVWGCVASVLVAWLAFGALSVRRIVRSGRELDDRAWMAPLCEIADRLDLDAVPRLLASPLIEMPFACGIVEPTIVLPASAEQWSDNRRRAVLFHELAHVRRHDLVGHTLGRIACALYWFHPLVWTAARRLRAESERACDDLVLSCGARASDYADHLLDIVISVRHHGAPATAMPMARRRELEGRVLAILDPAVARIGPGRVQSATLVAGLGALALSIAAIAPVQRVQHTAATQRAATDHRSVMRLDSAPSRATVVHNEASHAVTSASRTASANPQSAVTPMPAPAASPAPEPAVSEPATLTQVVGAFTKVAVREAASMISGAASSKAASPTKGVDSAKVALLVKVLRSDPDAQVRRMAAWGLSEAGDILGASDALVEAVRSDEDDNVREMAAWALADSRRVSAHRALAAAVRRDPSEQVRESAAWALAQDGLRDEDREVMETALTSDESEHVRETAAWALGNTPSRPASRALVTALGDRSPEVRESAAWALAEIEDEDVGSAVQSAFVRETNSNVRMAELRALTFMHVDDKSLLDAALASKDPELRAHAVRLLAGGSSSWPQPRPRPRPRPMP
jgi:beta-lactamase regulating signal transducer with metallopeptidase domain/HEAT repeat protein